MPLSKLERPRNGFEAEKISTTHPRPAASLDPLSDWIDRELRHLERQFAEYVTLDSVAKCLVSSGKRAN